MKQYPLERFKVLKEAHDHYEQAWLVIAILENDTELAHARAMQFALMMTHWAEHDFLMDERKVWAARRFMAGLKKGGAE